MLYIHEVTKLKFWFGVDKKSVVTGAETKPVNSMDQGEAGDNVGCCWCGIDKNETQTWVRIFGVLPGQVKARPVQS